MVQVAEVLNPVNVVFAVEARVKGCPVERSVTTSELLLAEVTCPVPLVKSAMLLVVALGVVLVLTVTLGVMPRAPALLSSESLELKSMASWMGVPAVKVKGNGAVVIMTEDAESAGVREQGEVVAVLVAQVLVPSESEEPVLLRTLTCGFAKVMVIPE